MLIGFIEKKIILDPWNYFLGVEWRLWKYSQGIEDGFGIIPKI